jgi:hypothetical protein
MPIDGVYTNDPSEAVEFVRDKVLGRKLMGGAWVEFRPTQLSMGAGHLGLARMQAANRMDLAMIPRVAIGPPKKKQVQVRVIPQQGRTPADIEAALQTAGIDTRSGQVGAATYQLGFPEDTSPEQLVAFAQQAILAQGVAPDQGWQWIKRGGDQIPS